MYLNNGKVMQNKPNISITKSVHYCLCFWQYLRQVMLTLQILQKIDNIWKKEGLDLR